jgi:hypothetical protein
MEDTGTDSNDNKPDISDECLDPEEVEFVSRYRHPDEIGEGWHPCRDFIDPLADALEGWLRRSEAEGLDYSEPTTLDRLMFILAGIIVVGGGCTQNAAWSRARAWFDVHGPDGLLFFRRQTFLPRSILTQRAAVPAMAFPGGIG